MAWKEEVKKLKTPVLIIAGDADVATLEHTVALFRLLGVGVMGDMGNPCQLRVLPLCRPHRILLLSIPDLLIAMIEPFLKGEKPKGFLEK